MKKKMSKKPLVRKVKRGAEISHDTSYSIAGIPESDKLKKETTTISVSLATRNKIKSLRRIYKTKTVNETLDKMLDQYVESNLDQNLRQEFVKNLKVLNSVDELTLDD